MTIECQIDRCIYMCGCVKLDFPNCLTHSNFTLLISARPVLPAGPTKKDARLPQREQCQTMQLHWNAALVLMELLMRRQDIRETDSSTSERDRPEPDARPLTPPIVFVGGGGCTPVVVVASHPRAVHVQLKTPNA